MCKCAEDLVGLVTVVKGLAGIIAVTVFGDGTSASGNKNELTTGTSTALCIFPAGTLRTEICRTPVVNAV